jgi:hypothetical protein
LRLLVLSRLLLALLLREKFKLVVLQLFLESLVLDLVLEDGLLVVLDLVLHALDLPLLLLQSLLVDGDHLLLLH